jgi:hypothetical protein
VTGFNYTAYFGVYTYFALPQIFSADGGTPEVRVVSRHPFVQVSKDLRMKVYADKFYEHIISH